MDHAYKWNLSSLKGERGYFDLDLAEEKGLETDFASSALPHRFAAPEYVQKLKERFDSGKIPTPEMKALLKSMVKGSSRQASPRPSSQHFVNNATLVLVLY